MTSPAPREAAATARSLQMIVGLARALAQVRTDPRAIAEATARKLVQDFADGGAIHLTAGFEVRVFAHRDLAAEEFLRDNFADAPVDLLPSGRVIASGKPLFRSHLPPEFIAELLPEARAYLRRFSTRGLIVVPIRAQDGVVGALSMWRDRDDLPFTHDDLDIAHVCAEHVGLALEHAAVFQALRDREARFELAARATQDVLWDWDLRADRVEWNEAIHTTLGWPPERVDPTYEWWAQHIHPDDRERVVADVQRAIRDNPTNLRWQAEYRFLRGDGRHAHIACRGFVLRGDEGQPVRVVGSMQDITERVEVTQRLARSEESYRAFIANSTEGIWCFETADPVDITLPPDVQIDQWYERARLVECNDVMARMYGYERPQDIIGLPLDSLFPRADPHIHRALRAFIASGYKISDLETVERDRHGAEHRFLNNLTGVIEHGKLRRAWATQLEVTELTRQAATLARYQLLSRHGRDIILFIRAATGEILEANDAAVAAYGYTRDELCALRIDALRPDPEQHPIGTADQSAEGAGVMFETVHRRKDGTTFPVEVSARGADVHGERLVLSIIRDLTRRRRIEAAARSTSAILQAVCDNTPDLVFAKDRDGRLLFANIATLDALEGQSDDVLGHRDHDLHVLASGRTELFEEDASDGRVFLTSKSPYRDASGAVVGLVGISMDITDRKQAELRLRRSQELISRVMRAGSMGTWMLDVGTGATWLSRELEELLGLTASAPLPGVSHLYDYIHPDDRQRVAAEIDAAGASRRDYIIEFRFLRADTGEQRWMECRGRVARDGLAPMVYGVGIDITARKRAELELRDSEELFATAFGKNPTCMTVNSLPGGEYLEINEAALQMGGFTRDEIIGATPQSLGLFATRDDQARFERLLAAREPVRDVELRLRAKLGRIYTVLVSAEVIPYRNRPCLLTVVLDITARKRVEWALLDSEQRFNQIAAAIDEAFWLLEFQPTQRFVYVSPAWERMWHIAPEQLYADPTEWSRPLHPDDRELVEQALRDLCTGRSDSRDVEYRLLRPDGEVMWIRGRGTLIRDVEGRPWRAAGIAEDITARKLDEREHERLVADLQVAIAVRDDFLSIASHELRTPLTALEFHLEHLVRLVERGERDPQTLERKVTSAVRQVDRVIALIDSLIHVSRMSLGRLTLDLSSFDLVALVRDVVARLGPDAQRARCAIHLDVPPRLHGVWDRKQLDQAIYNVLANAIKYGAGLPVDVHVRLCHGDDTVAIEVKDRGIGIAHEDMPRIFDRFERAVSSSHYGGFGLGLYIARRIVEAHGGALDVASAPGRGSTFRALLPASPPNHE